MASPPPHPFIPNPLPPPLARLCLDEVLITRAASTPASLCCTAGRVASDKDTSALLQALSLLFPLQGYGLGHLKRVRRGQGQGGGAKQSGVGRNGAVTGEGQEQGGGQGSNKGTTKSPHHNPSHNPVINPESAAEAGASGKKRKDPNPNSNPDSSINNSSNDGSNNNNKNAELDILICPEGATYSIPTELLQRFASLSTVNVCKVRERV